MAPPPCIDPLSLAILLLIKVQFEKLIIPPRWCLIDTAVPLLFVAEINIPTNAKPEFLSEQLIIVPTSLPEIATEF